MSKFLTIAAAAAVAVIGVASTTSAACDSASYVAKCEGMLSEGYKVLNTYTFDNKEGKAKMLRDDNVLTSRLSYEVAVCQPGDAVSFSLETGSGMAVDTGMAKGGVSAIKVPKMTVYYLQFAAAEPADFCGAAVLGVKR